MAKEEKKQKRLNTVEHLRAALYKKTSPKNLAEALSLLEKLNKKFEAAKAEMEEKKAKANKALEESGLTFDEFCELVKKGK